MYLCGYGDRRWDVMVPAYADGCDNMPVLLRFDDPLHPLYDQRREER